MSNIHFVGVTPEQYWSALRVWGTPDFVHERATWSAMGAVPPADQVIFGNKAFPIPRKWRGGKRLNPTAHGYNIARGDGN